MTIEEETVFYDGLEILGFGERITENDDMRNLYQKPIKLGIFDGTELSLSRVTVEKYAIQSMAHFIWCASLVMYKLIADGDIPVKDKKSC
jgi:hypothetical protein